MGGLYESTLIFVPLFYPTISMVYVAANGSTEDFSNILPNQGCHTNIETSKNVRNFSWVLNSVAGVCVV